MSAWEMAAELAAALGAVVAVLGLASQIRRMLLLPYKGETAPPKGSSSRGVIYALSLGMAPWAKESTRRHWMGYLRGIVFHVGVFAALAALLIGPWVEELSDSARWALAILTLAGGLAGLGGLAARFVEHNLRDLSTPDDYFSVGLVSLFVLTSSSMMATAEARVLFYSVGAITLVALPFTKVRHCVYFFFSRIIFGAFFGHRGVIEEARVRQ
ncbi:MAG: hypothetical protein M1358_23665 [Chloroflexi bacterium]|nr:hypothetical protein [Chloroflexota bacterium]